ncbi:hypothetical protein AB5J72_04810 [Streptomyces sp. CG1]|uniref:hypothetical protein n=1 Tax=Streptomyces sp. CG1 TaxID=1287523 RepID=UPI0034E2FE29
MGGAALLTGWLLLALAAGKHRGNRPAGAGARRPGVRGRRGADHTGAALNVGAALGPVLGGAAIDGGLGSRAPV